MFKDLYQIVLAGLLREAIYCRIKERVEGRHTCIQNFNSGLLRPKAFPLSCHIKINYFGKGSMWKSYRTLQPIQQASKWHSATKRAYTFQLGFVKKRLVWNAEKDVKMHVPGSPKNWLLWLFIRLSFFSPNIHPASRGVVAHTAGLFRSVRGAKGGFPPWGLFKLRSFNKKSFQNIVFDSVFPMFPVKQTVIYTFFAIKAVNPSKTLLLTVFL